MSQTKAAKVDEAIEALLRYGTVVRAAKHCSYSRQHLTRLLQDPDFQQQYRAARRRVYDQGLGRLIAAMNDAVEVLIAYATGESYRGKDVTKDMYLGSKAIIDHCHHIAAGDVESQLAEIRQMISSTVGGLE